MKKLFLAAIASLISLGALRAQDPWVITASGTGSEYYGITVANGTIGMVSSPQPMKIKETVMAGVYDRFGRGRVSNFLPSFNLLDTEIAVDGATVRASNVKNFTQRLDMKRAEFTGSFDHSDKVSVHYTYRALRQLPHCVMMDVTVKAHRDTEIRVRNIHQTPSSLHGQQNYFNALDFPDKPGELVQMLTTVAMSPSETVTISASSAFLFPEPAALQPRVHHSMQASDSHYARFHRELKAGEEYSFSVLGALTSSEHTADPHNQSERLLIYMLLQRHGSLAGGHELEWARLWESDIIIEGNPQDQQDVRSMLYHLYSFVRKDTAHSPSPMGLSGLGYNGHVFWDTELWMYPPMLILQPEIARSMLEYRFQRLPQARKNAAVFGYAGAMFPWESAGSGTEETPVFALSGPFEHHITACVGVAAWNYYLVTGDLQWLREKGWPMIKATAEFWASRAEKGLATEDYSIRNVMGADEWAINVDNNAFTNAIVKRNLEYAAAAAKAVGEKAPAEWAAIASGLRFSKMDNGVTREHDSYAGEPIKQADVNLLAYPLGIVTDPAQIRRDLDYYSAKVPEKGTPAMTQAIFSILSGRLGDTEEAYHWFADSFRPNLAPPFRVIAETKGGRNPYFATGAGGTLQAVIMGFGGIEIDPKGGLKQVKTALPPQWDKLTIKGVGKDKKTIVVTR